MDTLGRPKLFRKLSRDEKIAKIRMLEMLSAGLSLTSAVVILTVLAGGNDMQILYLALLCCFLVAVYQLVNFCLGWRLQRKVERSRGEGIDPVEGLTEKKVRTLDSGDATPFVNRPSVVENTTELLEPIPRGTKRVE